jgi:peptide/nickel transport system permease protein
LTAVAFPLVVITAIPLGVISAYLRNTKFDLIINMVSYLGISFPEFVVGTFLIVLFGGPIFGFFPSGGYAPLHQGFIPWIQHIILPAVTLTILIFAHSMRQTRSSMVETLQSEYVRTARLKGMGEYNVVVKHALRNGLLPAITVLAMSLGWMIGSIVVVEEIFAYPGLGRLVVRAIQSRDIPLLQITIVVAGSGYVLANLVADLLYSYLDPRIEYE